MFGRNDAQCPRAALTVAAEEALGPLGVPIVGESHPESRHVFNAGTGIQDWRDLCLRGAFKRIVERGSLRTTAMGLDATAFLTSAGADHALAGAFTGALTSAWARPPRPARDRLASTSEGSYAVTASIPSTPVGIATRTAPNAHAPALRPAHRPQWPPAGTPGATTPYSVPNAGQRPLSNHPLDLAEWRAWYTANVGPVVPPTTPGSPHEPLTTYRETRRSRARLVVRGASAPGTHGFVVITFYPIA